MNVDEWVRTQVTRFLAAVDATADEWDDPTRVRFLRLVVEREVDELEAMDDQYFDFIATCTRLASENMQDARLATLEQQVEEVQHPPFKLAQTLLEGALILIGEVMIAGSAYYAVPALLALTYTSAIRRARDELKVARGFSHRMSEVIDEIQGGLARDMQKALNLRALLLEPGAFDDAVRARALYDELQDVARSVATGRDQLRAIEAARDTSDEVATRAASAYAEAKNTKFKADNLNALLDGVLGQTVVFRIGETVGEDIAALSLELWSQTHAEARTTFETSGYVGDFLAAIEEQRRNSRAVWADLRLRVRFVPEGNFCDSKLIQGLIGLAQSSKFETLTPWTFTARERSVFVDGFEALLWHAWCAYNNLLQVVPFEDRDPDCVHPAGEVFAGYLVKESEPDDAPDGYGCFISGNYYSGAARLNDEQAEYLYKKFARGYFVLHPSAVPAPMKFNAARYDEVWSMPKANFGIENGDRIALLDAVKVLVITYFLRGGRPAEAQEQASGTAAQKIRDAIRKMLGLDPNENPLQEILDGLPRSKGGNAPALSQSQSETLTKLASALSTTGGLERKWSIGAARAQLESALVALELNIVTHSLQTTSDDAEREIEEQQTRVSTRYEAFLKLAADDRALVTQVQQELDERIRRSIAWSPARAAASNWQWYGPDPSAPAS